MRESETRKPGPGGVRNSESNRVIRDPTFNFHFLNIIFIVIKLVNLHIYLLHTFNEGKIYPGVKNINVNLYIVFINIIMH